MAHVNQHHAQANYVAALIAAAKKTQQKTDQQAFLIDVHGVSIPKHLGIKPTSNTLVRLGAHESEKKSSSMISLHEEFYFHLALAARVYGEIAVGVFPTNHAAMFNKKALLDLVKEAYQATMVDVNRHIDNVYIEAFQAAKEPEGVNLETLNTLLDNARKKMVPMAHTILMEKLIEKTGIILTEKNFKKAKRIAENTPALTQDMLYVNQEEGLVTLIKGSEYTAHYRMAGKDAFAHRQIITCRIDAEGNVMPGLHPRIQIRTPSPVVKKGLKKEAIISDVADKLSEITDAYALKSTLSHQKTKAFVYNRYTAINDRLGDTGGNLQTQSAAHILQGAHQYNASHHLDEDPVFCFVQNISVNGFGNTLSYKRHDALVKESTLMAEMALMHTLCDNDQFNDVFSDYKAYLASSPREPYFSKTAHGQAAIAKMSAIKKAWKHDVMVEHVTDPLVAAKMSLKKLVAHDAHLTHHYAKLIQTLSVFCEEASIGGCKSGNERAQAINGRVLMLDAMKTGSELETKLINLAEAAKQDVLVMADKFNASIHEQYNQKGLYAAASWISFSDQGASAKVEAKHKGFHISRNFAEESAEHMTNLKQSKAGAMQAHKGLTHYMRGAWSDYAMSDWFYMSSSFLGVFGAIAATVTVVPAILASLKNRHQKYQKSEARRMKNERIQAIEMCSSDNKSRIKGWLDKIGTYDAPENQRGNLEKLNQLNTQAKQALYRSTYKGIEPKCAREDFIRFLGLRLLEGHALSGAEARRGKTVTLHELLGDEGFRLYKKAMKEEGKSRAFREAVFSKALKFVEGKPWSKRLILWVGGPSSSGKTYSAKNVLNYLAGEKSNPLGAQENDKEGSNGVVFADGSFDRETSQMRQMVLQCALASGYKGIRDLYKHGAALMVRNHLKHAALASDHLSLVIPETFTRPSAIKEMLNYESLIKKGKFVQILSEIKAEESHDKSIEAKHEARFRATVNHMGELRAWRTEPFDASEIRMNNMNIGCESKIYEPQNFFWGRLLTKDYKALYKRLSQGKATLKITHDLMYVQKKEDGSWQECVLDDDLSDKKQGVDLLLMTARAYHAWSKLEGEKPDLVAWYNENKDNKALTGSLIEFKDNEKYKKSLLSSGLFHKKPKPSDTATADEKEPLPKISHDKK